MRFFTACGEADRSGAMDFDSTETRMVFGKDRKIREIVPVVRNDAHRLIEECMLCANVAAADLLENAKLPALYRVHEGPNQDKLDSLRDFLSEMGLYLSGGDKCPRVIIKKCSSKSRNGLIGIYCRLS